MEVSGQLHAPASLLLYPLERADLDAVKKSISLDGNQTLIPQLFS
jgi:hypothetical protein